MIIVVSEINQTQKGTVISIRVRDEENVIIEDIAKKLYSLGWIKTPTAASLAKSSLLVTCNQFLQIEKQAELAGQPIRYDQPVKQPQAQQPQA
jgi:hypothetical protein